MLLLPPATLPSPALRPTVLVSSSLRPAWCVCRLGGLGVAHTQWEEVQDSGISSALQNLGRWATCAAIVRHTSDGEASPPHSTDHVGSSPVRARREYGTAANVRTHSMRHAHPSPICLRSAASAAPVPAVLQQARSRPSAVSSEEKLRISRRADGGLKPSPGLSSKQRAVIAE